MSIFSENKNASGTFGQAAQELANALRAGDKFDITQQHAANMVNMESMVEPHIRQELTQVGKDARATMKNLMEQVGLSVEGIKDHQWDAGTVALVGGANATKFHQAATNMNFSSEGATVMPFEAGGAHGQTDAIFTPDGVMAMEAFENKDLSVVQAFSAVWNIGATRQDSASELLYPTHVLTPDHTALDVKIPRTLLFKGQPRNFNGDPADFGFQNALEAYRNHKLLENETTEVIPYVLEDGSNAHHFVDSALIKGTEKPMEGSRVSFKTAPLRINAQFDLLSISHNPLILDGATNESDQLHSKIVMKNLYLKFANTDTKEVSAVKFRTENFTRAIFTKTVEGDFMEMQLTFDTEDLSVDHTTKDTNGVAAAALAELAAAGYQVRLFVSVSGKVNLQTGLTRLYAAIPEVAAVTKDGEVVSHTSGQVKDMLAKLEMAVVAYDLQAFRTNSNLRTRGLLVDRNWKVDRFAIPLGAPLSVIVPLTDDGEAQAMNDLINITNIRNSNIALTRALNYAESLNEYCKANADVVAGKRVSLSIEGIARYLITPYYKEVELDIEKELQSLNSTDRVGDVNAVLVNCIRTTAYDALVASNYLPALRQFTQGSDEKPHLLIVTDLTLPQYLMITGDPRTVSIGMDFTVESSPDTRLTDTILMTFGRKSRSGPDYMSFGTHVWIPELVSMGQIHYQGANVKQLMVQPRNSHIHQLPIFMKIKVKNLREAIAKLSHLKVESTPAKP